MGMRSALAAEGSLTRQRLDPEAGLLVGMRCKGCDSPSWPSRAVCHVCGSPELAEAGFGPGGALLCWTRVWVPRPGIEAPYTLCQVEIDNGPIVFGHLKDEVGDDPVGARVSMMMSGDPDDIPPFWFVFAPLNEGEGE